MIKLGKIASMLVVFSLILACAQEGAKPQSDGDGKTAAGAPADTKLVTNEVMELACGACIYKMPGVEGCPLAIKLDGKPYLVKGAAWPNHDYCDRTCQGTVTGRLEGDTFVIATLEPRS